MIECLIIKSQLGKNVKFCLKTLLAKKKKIKKGTKNDQIHTFNRDKALESAKA